MTMVKNVLTLLLGGLLLFAGTVEALEIVYPADMTVVVRSDYLIVKAGETPKVDALTVEINGVGSDPIDIASDEYRAAFKDFLILQPEWDRGRNTIRVRAYAAGKEVADASASLFYVTGDDAAAILPAGYKPFVMHVPNKEALCVPCHNMKPDNVQLRGATAASNPCASCHGRMLAKPFVHGPEGVFQCVDCHDASTAPARWQVTKNNFVLCGECHIDKITEFKKNAFVHGPVGVGDCVVCHDPHASDQPMQLHSGINALCLSCHESVKQGQHVLRGVGGTGHPLDKVTDPLDKKGRALSCASCHDPHGGPTRYFYRQKVTTRYALCQLCHVK